MIYPEGELEQQDMEGNINVSSLHHQMTARKLMLVFLQLNHFVLATENSL